MTRQHCPIHGYGVLHVDTKHGPVCAQCINARSMTRKQAQVERKRSRPPQALSLPF